MTSEGGFAPLPTVVARLTARSSLPPPKTRNRIARAKPAVGAAMHAVIGNEELGV